jgi:hypothetical protein
MATYIQTDELQKMIDWDNIMKMSRYAGGHDDQMIGLFKDSTVIGHWNESDYQGSVATCVELSNGRYAIYNDYYGSCSGCDSWDGADDESVRAMCINLSNSAYIFESLYDVISYLKSTDDVSYSWKSASKPLLDEILKNVQMNRDIKISEITQ